ncbi:MAG: phosphotransferase [Candidatus Microsaccharimonas sp.]
MRVELAEQALELYGLDYARILSVQTGYRNHIFPVELHDGTMVQLTLYKSEPDILARIQRSDTVSGFAAEKGLPTRTRKDPRTIRMRGSTKDIFAALYNYLPGETIAWEAYTTSHLKSLGKTMSDLHGALKDFDTTSQILVIDELESLLGRMRRYFEAKEVMRAMHDKLSLTFSVSFDRYERLLSGCRALQGTQQLHMDFVRGNVLFDRQEITGILDFEKTSVGHPLFDVARTLAFLLVDCKYKTEDEVRRYFLQSGYHKRGASKLDYYPGLLERLVEFFLLHDFYKFLRHNPYESLNDNEHFVRTVSMLTRGGVLHYT